jgi:hypothetical protein
MGARFVSDLFFKFETPIGYVETRDQLCVDDATSSLFAWERAERQYAGGRAKKIKGRNQMTLTAPRISVPFITPPLNLLYHSTHSRPIQTSDIAPD